MQKTPEHSLLSVRNFAIRNLRMVHLHLKNLEEARFEKKFQISATMKLICLITGVNPGADAAAACAAAACGPVGIWNFVFFLLPPILAKEGIQEIAQEDDFLNLPFRKHSNDVF